MKTLTSPDDSRAASEMIWLRQPAQHWLDALPIGNGRIGALVFGGTDEERLALNHENLWRGGTRERTTDAKAPYLAEMRRRFFEDDLLEAGEYAAQHLSGHQRRVMPYQPLGDLKLQFAGHEQVERYRRTLDLATGTVQVTYTLDGVSYKREVFASAEHGVLVVRLSADAPHAITANIILWRSPHSHCILRPWATTSASDSARLGFRGHFIEGINFAAEARVVARGGTANADPGSLHTAAYPHGRPPTVCVQGADEVLVVLGMGTDYHESDPQAECAQQLDAVPLDFRVLQAAHLAEHRALFERVHLDLPAAPDALELATDERVARAREGQDDPSLSALMFQYGRYLLMASSRRCDQPANLQGIWNVQLAPPWESDFHHDVNIQMNYWIAEVGNLAECVAPLAEYLWRAVPQGEKAAQDLYGCRGIYLPIQTDVWDRATPESPIWDVWTGAAAWLAQHLWMRWEYALDRAFLAEQVYPFYKRVAAFYEDYLVPDPRSSSPHQGRLVTVPSQSPENPFVGATTPVGLCIGATMDFILIREVLTRCLEASQILACDAELRPIWERILAELAPYQIGQHGQLQEWLEDYEEVEPGHRHLSHLLGVYPGDQMLPESDPEFGPAARRAVERRAEGAPHGGWSGAWLACMWARYGEAERAYGLITQMIGASGRSYLSDSLFNAFQMGEPVFQIDANLGIPAALAEMLLQSHQGVIRLMPALPAAWSEGQVAGLVARGAFVVDMAWSGGQLVEAHITSRLGQPCRLVVPWEDGRLGLTEQATGAAVAYTRDPARAGCVVFSTAPGGVYVVRGEGEC